MYWIRRDAEQTLRAAGLSYEILQMEEPGFFETYGMSLILCGLMIFFIVMTMGGIMAAATTGCWILEKAMRR